MGQIGYLVAKKLSGFESKILYHNRRQKLVYSTIYRLNIYVAHKVLRVYIHACMHTYIHTYMHTYIHTHIYTYIHTYIHTFLQSMHN